MTRIKPTYFFLAVALLLLSYNPMATLAANYNYEISKVAGSVYASYRVVNKIASMFADIDVQVLVMTFSPGELLQSIIDTLDRFADILFSLMILSGILGFIIVPIAKIGAVLATLGTLLQLGTIRLMSTNKSVAIQLTRLSSGLISIGFLLALIIPSGYSIGYAIGENITKSAWSDAVEAFDLFASEVSNAETQVPEPSDTQATLATENDNAGTPEKETCIFSDVLGKLSGKLSAGAESVAGATRNIAGRAWNLVAKIRDLPSKVGKLVEATFAFLVAYIIKTIVIPLVIIALAMTLWRRMVSSGLTQPVAHDMDAETRRLASAQPVRNEGSAT